MLLYSIDIDIRYRYDMMIPYSLYMIMIRTVNRSKLRFTRETTEQSVYNMMLKGSHPTVPLTNASGIVCVRCRAGVREGKVLATP